MQINACMYTVKIDKLTSLKKIEKNHCPKMIKKVIKKIS